MSLGAARNRVSLGSDTLRRYACGDLETTVSYGRRFQRGQRFIIYDGGGEFDRNFDWCERFGNGKDHLIRLQLPFKNGRSDLLAGSGGKLDLENVNLVAALLIHAEHQGYWSKLGERFEEDMQSLLDRHLLAGLIAAPWVRADEDSHSAVAKKTTSSSQGILHEMRSLLKKYRAEIVRQSRLADEGGRT